MATRAKRTTKAGKNHASLELLEKLKFVSQIQNKKEDFSAHCIIKNRMICATDGVFSIGIPIDEDIEACPHSHSLISALSKCGEQVIVAIDKHGVSVTSGKLSVKIAGVDPAAMPPIEPDRILVPLNNELKTAFEVVGVLAKEGDLMLHKATVLLQANIVSATNGFVAMQYRHGIDLPPDLVLPKKFADLVVKNGANLTGFGWTYNRSVTFWFDNGSFIKTQLQRGAWPNVDYVLNYNSWPVEMPEDFAEAVKVVSSFSNNDIIEFGDGVITSNIDGKNLASYEVEGLPEGRLFNGKMLSMVVPFIEVIDFVTDDSRALFFGCDGKMRGAIVALKRS